MQHDHQVSKARGKAAGPATRREASTQLSAAARAVVDLQHAAGNRAVAKMLSGSARGAHGPQADRGPISPISLQRDPLDDALKHEMDGRDVDYLKLAHALVTGADTLIAGAGTSSQETGTAANGTGTALGGKSATLPTKTEEQRAAEKRTKELAEMKRLKNLSPDEIKARDKSEAEDDELADWKEKQKAAKEARSSVREAARLNPEKKSMRSLLKGRSF
jgi:hypothetical protein